MNGSSIEVTFTEYGDEKPGVEVIDTVTVKSATEVSRTEEENDDGGINIYIDYSYTDFIVF